MKASDKRLFIPNINNIFIMQFPSYSGSQYHPSRSLHNIIFIVLFPFFLFNTIHYLPFGSAGYRLDEVRANGSHDGLEAVYEWDAVDKNVLREVVPDGATEEG